MNATASVHPIRGPLVVPELDPRERKILAALAHHNRFVRPMDVGGFNSTAGSNHSYRLTKLVRLGLVERRWRTQFTRLDLAKPNKTFEYKITEDGLRFISP